MRGDGDGLENDCGVSRTRDQSSPDRRPLASPAERSRVSDAAVPLSEAIEGGATRR